MSSAQTSSDRKPTDAETQLASYFAAQPAADAPRLAALRSAGFDAYTKTGLPNRRDEAWKYTDLRALLRDVKPLATPPDAIAKASAKSAAALDGVDARRIVFVGGYFAPELSDLEGLEKGLEIVSLSEALAKGDAEALAHLGRVSQVDDAAFALNTAFMAEGVVVNVAAGASIERPIQLVYVGAATSASCFLRSLIVIGEGARATLIESFEAGAASDYQINAATEVVLSRGAALERVKVSREGGAAMHVATFVASLAEGAQLSDFCLNFSGALLRNQSFISLAGVNCRAEMRGATILKDKEHADSTLFLDHQGERAESMALFKSVLDNTSQSVFQGKISVRPGAQKTDARMMARALLLSDSATAFSKPELEIFADDVQCAHGSTIGALDENLTFYLMARGIPREEAEALLVEAFVGETLDAVSSHALRDALTTLLSCRLRG